MEHTLNDLVDCWCGHDNDCDCYWSTRPIARKIHRCCECGRVIEPGERYERMSGIWGGSFDTSKTCLYCLAERDDNYRTQIWSSGGGVNSAAIAALIISGKIPKPDLAVIIDTEREMSTTWERAASRQ